MNIQPIFDTDQSIDQTNYYWFENSLSNNELIWIDILQNKYQYEKANTIGNPDDILGQFRKSLIKWLPHDSNTYILYDKFKDMMIEANNSIWKFDLGTIRDSIQYTEYLEGGGHYDWHVDIGPGSINHRKISLVTQLSDSDEYEGGDLEIWTGGSPKKIPRQKGTTVIFPSFLMHRVTPVTKGIRKSLVLWAGGSSYK